MSNQTKTKVPGASFLSLEPKLHALEASLEEKQEKVIRLTQQLAAKEAEILKLTEHLGNQKAELEIASQANGEEHKANIRAEIEAELTKQFSEAAESIKLEQKQKLVEKVSQLEATFSELKTHWCAVNKESVLELLAAVLSRIIGEKSLAEFISNQTVQQLISTYDFSLPVSLRVNPSQVEQITAIVGSGCQIIADDSVAHGAIAEFEDFTVDGRLDSMLKTLFEHMRQVDGRK